jgi:peptidoglycan/LPS O-acetylase OafA/YrhL
MTTGNQILPHASSDPAVYRLVFVDYLRGLAALSVAWFHVTNGYASASPTRLSGSYGWLGVEVFFVISGFIIPWSMKSFRITSIGSYCRFISRRALRVELPYLVSIGLVIALWFLSSSIPSFRGTAPEWSLEQIGLHILYLIPFSHQTWLQPVYWSLAYEFAFYLVIGIIFSPIVARPQRWPFCLLTCAMALSVLAGVVSPLFLLFIMGCAAYRRSCGSGDAVECLFTISVALAVMATRDEWLEGMMGAISTLLIILYVSRSFSGVIGSSLGWLGSISYSLYLLHVPVGGRIVNLGQRFIHDETSEFALSLVALAVSIVFAWAFYRVIERPAHKLAQWAKPVVGPLPMIALTQRG